MSTKPDYEAAQKIIDNGWRAAIPIVDAALGGDPLAWAVAALIAEGGTIEEVGEPGYYDHHGNDGAFVAPGRYLVFPIPVEEETTT